MPRFFKRLFKFPQMDFEMAFWEIMSLIIAPKKVFRQIYYHVRPETIHTHISANNHIPETNHKNLPPPRPLLHLPPLPLPNPYFPRLGLRLRRRLHTNPAHHPRLHIRALPAPLPPHRDLILLPRGAAARAWRELAPPRATTGSLQLERGRWWQRRVGIWILLGCSHPSICAGVGVFVRGAVSVHAACWDGALVRTFTLWL